MSAQDEFAPDGGIFDSARRIAGTVVDTILNNIDFG